MSKSDLTLYHCKDCDHKFGETHPMGEFCPSCMSQRFYRVKIWKCWVCDREFETYKGLRVHQVRIHGTFDKRLEMWIERIKNEIKTL